MTHLPIAPVRLTGLTTVGRATDDGTAVDPGDPATTRVVVTLHVAPDVDVHRVVRVVRDAVDLLGGELRLERGDR